LKLIHNVQIKAYIVFLIDFYGTVSELAKPTIAHGMLSEKL